mgnify:CR=1 FL=1
MTEARISHLSGYAPWIESQEISYTGEFKQIGLMEHVRFNASLKINGSELWILGGKGRNTMEAISSAFQRMEELLENSHKEIKPWRSAR